MTDVTPAQHAKLKAMADAAGLTLGSWLYLQLAEKVNGEAPGSEGD